jgi:hypothetical protein
MSIIAISSISSLFATSGLIGSDIVIKTIVNISSNLINSVTQLKILSEKDVDLQKLLVKSDIIQDILIIKSFIEENKSESYTILTCINNLKETMQEIETNINSISEKIKTHNNLWFKYFRYYDISSEKEMIPILIEKLRHRFNMVIKISSIANIKTV